MVETETCHGAVVVAVVVVWQRDAVVGVDARLIAGSMVVVVVAVAGGGGGGGGTRAAW